MNITIKINKQGVFTGKIFPAAGLLFFVLVMGFCAFYVSTGYYHLVSWYTGLNNCFYRHGQWTTDFFSNKTKDAGNLFCIPAFIIALAGAWLMIRKLKAGYKRPTEYLEISLRKADVAVAALLVLLSVVAWFWATTLAFPSNDEVFSAVNCAGLHPFQTVSYYMLPNNHLFYNFINNLLFHFVADKVASGRFLSLLFYLAIVLVTFSWLRGLLKSRWLAFLIVVALALQFPVWGFASQARGYELVTLASWLALSPASKPTNVL